jgi:hypothetical protein
LGANTKFLPKVGIKRATTSLYSLRHSFTTQLEHSEVPERIQKQFVGHSGGPDAHSSYVKPRELGQLVAAVWPVLDEWLPQVFKNLPRLA